MSLDRPHAPLLTLAALLLAAAFAACGGGGPTGDGPAGDGGAATGPLALAGTNYDGTPFRLAELDQEVKVLFFGYTFCPDVCPFTLAKMKQAMSRLGDDAGEVAVVFVTVDPHRDSLAKLASYVPNFDARFYGVRIAAEELPDAIEPFGVTVQYGQPKDGPGTDSFYYVDHTGSFFLLDGDDRLAAKLPPNASVDQLVPAIGELLGG